MAKKKISSIYPQECDNYFQADKMEHEVGLELYFDEILQKSACCIEDKVTEKRFNLRMSGKSSVFFLIGFRNTGKTVFLKQYFQIKRNTIFVRDSSLIVPILGTGELDKKTPYEKMVGTVKGICNVLEQAYEETASFCSERGTEEFYRFILETRAGLMPNLDYSEECRLSLIEKKQKRIEKMQRENTLSFFLIRLKFYLSCYCRDIRKVVIILDNLQKLFPDREEQQEYVRLLLQVYECLENYGDLKNFLIISVRPYEYRQLREDPYIAPYASALIWKENKFDSVELFRNVLEKYGEEITFDSQTLSPESKEFNNILTDLSQKFKRKYSDMIEKLCFYDAVLIMEAYKRILLNRTWVKEGKFRYKPNPRKGQGLLFDNITCIRALACGNSKVFRQAEDLESVPEIEKLIPNLLYNSEDKDYSLLILCTMKYFLRHSHSKQEWGGSDIVLEDYIQDFTAVFGDKKEELLETIAYMYHTGILRRSVLDAEKADGEQYNSCFGKKNKLYITSRGSKLWDMLKDDSVLLELCREDSYQEPGYREDCMKSSYDLMMEGKQSELFIQLLDLVRRLFEEELSYYRSCCQQGKREQYQRLFGRRPVTDTLLEGVAKSIQYSGFSKVMNNKHDLEAYMQAKWREMGE